MTAVFDASAVLAILNSESGADRARARLRGALISTVNAVEVGTRLVDGGMPLEAVRNAVRFLKLKVIDLDWMLADAAVEMRPKTRHRGLSLADRCCLALAIRENLPAVTADRKWAELDLPCAIELIR